MGDGGSSVDLDTAHGRDWPSVRQFNVFLENRVGVMLSLWFGNSKIRTFVLSCHKAPQNQPPMGASKSASVLLLLSHV
jgi:hypothetical protein